MATITKKYADPVPPPVTSYVLELSPEEAKGLHTLLHTGLGQSVLTQLKLRTLSEKLYQEMGEVKSPFGNNFLSMALENNFLSMALEAPGPNQ